MQRRRSDVCNARRGYLESPAIINRESRSSTHVVQIPSLVMAPIWWVLGIASITRNLFPVKLKRSTFIVGFIRSVLCFKRILLLGLARFYIYIRYARRHFYLPHKAPNVAWSKLVNMVVILLVYWCSKPWHMDGWKFSRIRFLIVWLSHLETFAFYISSTNFLAKGLQNDIFFHPTPNSCGISVLT